MGETWTLRTYFRLKKLIARADLVTKDRARRFEEEDGLSFVEAALKALHLYSEDRKALEFEGPLRIVDGKLVYFPVPGERRLPWDPPE